MLESGAHRQRPEIDVFPDITCDDIFRIETQRLWLRWLRASDAPSVAAFAGLAPVAQMTASIPHPYPPGEAERFIFAARGATAAGRALILAVTLKTKQRTLIGLVSAQSEIGIAHAVELGYVTAPPHAGRGYATEAVLALVDTVFNLTEVRHVTANSRTNNPASRRVLEKCGFAFVRTGLKDLPARGGLHPCDFLDLSRHQWANKQRERRLPAMPHQGQRDVQTKDEESQQQQQQQ